MVSSIIAVVVVVVSSIVASFRGVICCCGPSLFGTLSYYGTSTVVVLYGEMHTQCMRVVVEQGVSVVGRCCCCGVVSLNII